MFYSKNKKQTNTKKGFTLIEALVAISILMIAIASPMLLAQKSLSSANLSKDQMIATFLAQDAIEAVKNTRDETAKNPNATDWLDKLEPCVCSNEGEKCIFDVQTTNLDSSVKFCNIDTTNKSVMPGSNPNNELKISYIQDQDTKKFIKYDYNTNIGTDSELSKFTRYISIKKTNFPEVKGNEAIVQVRVTWNSTLGTQKIDLEDFIYNYSENI